MITKTITVEIPAGLEVRPVAVLVQVANQYNSSIYVESGNKKVNAKSIMGLMTLGLRVGESVTIKDSKVYINDSTTPLKEDYMKEEWVIANDGMQFQVPEGCYFMMGDNRNNSKDSRYWNNTYVARDKILAKAIFRYWGGFKLLTNTADYE